MANYVFDSIVSPLAEREDYQTNWNRQRETARVFLDRFESGFDTQLLADEVGMGKTYVAMGVIAAKLLRPTKNDRRALLITPPSAVLRSKWEQEIRSFSQNYLVKNSKRRSLRPLIVRNFWELVANLHDYVNVKVERVSEDLLCCILDSVWQWGVRNNYLSNRMNWFPRLALFKQKPHSAVSEMQFASQYSMAAWWSYLDEFKSGKEQSICDWIKFLRESEDAPASNNACEEIKSLFKKFAAEQDSYEPNVLILGMSALGSRSNQFESQRFSTFILGVLLLGRRQNTREAFLKALGNANILLPGADSKKLSSLVMADLYRTEQCVRKTLLENEELSRRWGELQGPDPAPAKVKSFFKDFMKAVVGQKLRESGIELAVVDEAHNWKDGKNGGSDFKEIFASAIHHKLLMSATPFQLAEGEMRRVFEHAVTPGGKTQEVLTQIYEQERVVEKCLALNNLFQKSWDRLSEDSESLTLLRMRIEESASESIRHALDDLGTNSAVTPILNEFCRSALAYRDSVEALAQWQRQIVVRHLKPRGHRSFHSGSDFGTALVQQRTALYETDGMTKESDAFINFLAMRLDQKIRINDGSLEAANAHLMGGLTSSKAAFKSSAAMIAQSKSAPDAVAQRYMAMFNSALDHHEHPKVLATVDHALTNYLNGKKTLIFCERVDTLKEIDSLLRARIEKELPRTDADLEATREKVLKDECFVDMRFSRLMCLHHFHGDIFKTDQLLAELRPQAVRFAVGCFSRLHAKVTARRVLRLMDLWAMQEIAERLKVKSAAMRIFRALYSIAASHDPLQAHWLEESILQSDTTTQIDSQEMIESQVDAIAEKCFGGSINLWEGADEASFIEAVWTLVESEAAILLRGSANEIEPELGAGFYATLIGMQRGLRKVLLRPDLFRGYVGHTGQQALPEAVYMGVRSRRGDGESTWSRMARFVQNLVEANGTINPDDTTNTRRRSLWRGVNLQGGRRGLLQGADNEAQTTPEDFAVQMLDGSVKPERRVVLCAAFNSPLAPDILICTSIGSEGIDLHKECAEVIHHDLPWNPARLEQRIGRIDRVGSLAEVSKPPVNIRIGIPFQEQSYERFQYNVLLARAQRFEVLLGKPDFDINALDEEDFFSEESKVLDLVEDSDATSTAPPPCLPDKLVQWFSVDLSLASVAV